MADQIVIANGESILVDNSFHIPWADKGKNWVDAWCPNTIHFVIWNNLPGQNEIQNKDASTGMMTSNTSLNATSDAVGSTTIADLLTWAGVRQLQIEEAIAEHNSARSTEFNTQLAAWEAADSSNNEDNFNTFSWSKTWRDYDPNYS
jgi:hypothetical protein